MLGPVLQSTCLHCGCITCQCQAGQITIQLAQQTEQSVLVVRWCRWRCSCCIHLCSDRGMQNDANPPTELQEKPNSPMTFVDIQSDWLCTVWQHCSRVGFNVPNTLKVISETIFTGQMTQPTVSSNEGQYLVSTEEWHEFWSQQHWRKGRIQ